MGIKLSLYSSLGVNLAGQAPTEEELNRFIAEKLGDAAYALLEARCVEIRLAVDRNLAPAMPEFDEELIRRKQEEKGFSLTVSTPAQPQNDKTVAATSGIQLEPGQYILFIHLPAHMAEGRLVITPEDARQCSEITLHEAFHVLDGDRELSGHPNFVNALYADALRLSILLEANSLMLDCGMSPWEALACIIDGPQLELTDKDGDYIEYNNIAALTRETAKRMRLDEGAAFMGASLPAVIAQCRDAIERQLLCVDPQSELPLMRYILNDGLLNPLYKVHAQILEEAMARMVSKTLTDADIDPQRLFPNSCNHLRDISFPQIEAWHQAQNPTQGQPLDAHEIGYIPKAPDLEVGKK